MTRKEFLLSLIGGIAVTSLPSMALPGSDEELRAIRVDLGGSKFITLSGRVEGPAEITRIDARSSIEADVFHEVKAIREPMKSTILKFVLPSRESYFSWYPTFPGGTIYIAKGEALRLEASDELQTAVFYSVIS